MLALDPRETHRPELSDFVDAARYDVLGRDDVIPVIVTFGTLHGGPCANASGGQLELMKPSELAQVSNDHLCGCSLSLSPTFDDLCDDVAHAMPAMSWLNWAQTVLKAPEPAMYLDSPDILAFGHVWQHTAAQQLLVEQDAIIWPAELGARRHALLPDLAARAAQVPTDAQRADLLTQCQSRLEQTLADDGVVVTQEKDLEWEGPIDLVLAQAALRVYQGDPTAAHIWLAMPERPGSTSPSWWHAVHLALRAWTPATGDTSLRWENTHLMWVPRTQDAVVCVSGREFTLVRVPTLVALVAEHLGGKLMGLTTEPVDVTTVKATMSAIRAIESDPSNPVDVATMAHATVAAAA